ncbi:hypothetical protein MG290_10100 [Flavobacterium sp. CBA20B-1]|uniref:hypothetical protein n=1 Tax=unclassified Flavobacterium TaxID=196869 RepID=UPI0022254ACC|nr:MULTISPECIES: hypothetical protein [unclassified Flavobacterium]WCM41307.1 hypothetical protein MG290_10100 [Flavobacterium sp. CBA20B-1]
MNRKLLSVSLLLFGINAYSQVGIGTLNPNSSSQLDVTSDKKGVLMPRVALSSTTDATTIQNGNVNSLLVFNTNNENDIQPGYYYWYIDKWMRIVNESDVIALDKNTTNTTLTVISGDLVLTDSDGNTVSVPLEAINISTNIVTYQGNQYYLSEEYILNGGSVDVSTWTSVPAGAVLLDVVGNVVTNIQNQGDIYSEIINILEQESDIFVDNGDGTFTHTAVDGTVMTFDANTLDMVNNNDSTYTFTNANGDTLTVDVVGDVVTNIQNQGDIYSEIINILEQESDIFTDNGDGTFTHTAVDGTVVTFDANTTAMVNNNDGTYTFTNANGDTLTVDVVGDVVTNIQNQGDIYSEIINILEQESDIFVDNGDGTFTHTAVDGTVVTFDANTTAMVDNGNGTYTFTNANGDTLTVDVVGDVVTNIQNQGDIYSEIINILEQESDIFVDNGDGTFTHTAVDGTVVTFDANTTAMVDNGNGTYTFTNANGDTLTVDVVGDVVTNIQNQGDIYSEIINILEQESDIFTDNGDGTFTHTAVDGTVMTFDANTTAMVDNGNGTYTFTNANGDTLTVDVVGDVVTNIQNQGDIYSEIINILEQESDIFVDNGDGTFTHTAVDGTVVTFDANTTAMVDNGDGTYTFTNANGDTITVDVVGDVVTNIQNQGDIYSEIINILEQESDIFVDNGDGTFTHTAVDGTVVTFDANTTAMVDNNDGTYTFTNANGDTLTVDVVGDVVTNIQNQGDIYSEIINILEQESDIFVDNGDGTFTHTAVDGTVVTFDANTTAMVENGDGTYTFTNANGDTITVDVVGDVVTNIQNQGDIYSEIINILEQESDIFVDNGDGTFTHTAVDGTVVTFDANTTAMVDNGDGTYTFTNANGDTITVDVVGDVVTNIQNQGDIYSEIINILEQESDIFVDNGDGTFTHTAVDGTVMTFDANTLDMVNNNDGTYTFTNANGDTITVDVVGDVVTNIQNQGDIYSEIINILEQESDIFVDNGDGTFTHTAVDGTVVTFDANTTAMVDNNDGTYTFTNANGDTLTVDVVGDVVTNIQNQGDIYSEIINILEQESDIFVDNGDGTFTHTAVDGTVVTFDANTTAMVDNGNGTYTFTNANGDTITVDVVGDVVTNIQNQGDIYSEIINILEQESDIFVDNGDGTFTHTAVDGTVMTFDANTLDMVNNNDGTYTFTNANGDTLTVDVVGDVVTNIQNQGDIYSEIINILEQESDIFVDNGDGTFTHTAVDGTVVTFDANTLDMVNNNDGTYTFTNANGDTITVDVVGDVVTNIQNQGDIYSEIINILEQESDIFVDNGDGTFTHTAVDGTVVTFDANTLDMVNNNDGTYTFTNANGDTITVDVVGDVVTNIQNQGDIYSEIINILEQESDIFVDNGDGTFTHTAVDGTVMTFDANTLDMVNNNDGTYTFTNANGDTLTVDVVGDVVTNIQNQGDIYSEIINILEQESDIFVDNGDGTFTHTAVDGTVVTFDANTLDMVNNNDGTYTFTNANGDTITVDVVGDVVTNIQNQGDIYSEIINILEQESDIFVDNGDGTFTHTAVDGTVVTFDANTLDMVNNNDGTYTFTNANGDTITVDVVGDVVTNIQNQGDIYSEIINILEQESDIFVDNGDGTFTHTAVDGTVMTFDANTLDMVNNNDGTYTFTNANGDTLTVDVVGDVVTNIQNQGDIYSEIINILEQESDIFVDNGDGTFTHTAVDGTVVTFDANTTAMVDNGDGTYTFTNANGDTITVDVVGDVVTNIQNQGDIYSEIINILEQESDIFVDNGDGTFTHTAVDGTVVTFDANTLDMVNNNDGTYTFTNANGDTITVDVVGDVVTNIQNQGDIYSEIINILEQESDIFVDNGDGTFTHTAVDGTVMTFDANTLDMVNNNDGTYTFTNANGDTLTVDVVGDVVTNIQNQGDIYSEIINILEQESDIFVDNGDGTFTHTAVDGTVVTFDANTLDMVNNNDGTYTFTNANGDTITVDVVGDVVTNIQNQGDIYSEIINILEQESDIFVDNGDGTFTHTAVDGTVVTFDANTLDMVNNNDGTYTFTNANGDTITVDVVGDVVTNIQNQGDIYSEIINILEQESDIFVDNGDGTFTHTAVDGTVVTFDANTTADNGLTKTNDNIQLGGTLIKPTSIVTDATQTLAIEGLEVGEDDDQIVVADETTGVLRAVKAAMPKFFYMPSVIMPTAPDQVPGMAGASESGGVYTINLHTNYTNQFSTPMASSETSASIPTLPANELHYHIVWYDDTVFENVTINASGIMTYTIASGADITVGSFMNIVFEVK